MTGQAFTNQVKTGHWPGTPWYQADRSAKIIAFDLI